MSYIIQVILTYTKKHIWNIYKIKKIVINLIHVSDVEFLKPTVFLPLQQNEDPSTYPCLTKELTQLYRYSLSTTTICNVEMR